MRKFDERVEPTFGLAEGSLLRLQRLAPVRDDQPSRHNRGGGPLPAPPLLGLDRPARLAYLAHHLHRGWDER